MGTNSGPSAGGGFILHRPPSVWWSQAGSNRRPLQCHCSALPAELWPREGANSRFGRRACQGNAARCLHESALHATNERLRSRVAGAQGHVYGSMHHADPEHRGRASANQLCSLSRAARTHPLFPVSFLLPRTTEIFAHLPDRGGHGQPRCTPWTHAISWCATRRLRPSSCRPRSLSSPSWAYRRPARASPRRLGPSRYW